MWNLTREQEGSEKVQVTCKFGFGAEYIIGRTNPDIDEQ